jgi:hypothetical protein
MFFTYIYLPYALLQSTLGAVHFFVEDVSKIFALLVVMIYFIALLRASLDVERVRDYLAGKNKGGRLFAGVDFWRHHAFLFLLEYSSLFRFYFGLDPPWDHYGLFDHFTFDQRSRRPAAHEFTRLEIYLAICGRGHDSGHPLWSICD